ncbi:hypothetical protein [Stappia indica]|nr:hypothetical protein [Stappia indica]
MTEPRRLPVMRPHTARLRRLALFWILNGVLAAGILVFALR